MSAESPSSLSSFITNNPIYANEGLRISLFTLGTIYASIKAFQLLKSISYPLIHTNKDLGARYGKKSWALITGASDGIGKAFAYELAKRGFNIILVGRNKEKLDQVSRDLAKEYPSAETRIVVADFAKAYEKGFAEKVYEDVKSLDVSILINNVGQGGGGYFYETPIDKMRDMIIVNCLSHALITRVMLPKLTKRGTRSAIINMSSTTAAFPRPFHQVYSSTKAFHDYLSKGLALEYPNIDVISLRPGLISTKMTRYKETDMKTILPEEFVSIALKALGSTNCTSGHIKHRWGTFVGENIPSFLRKYYFRRVFHLQWNDLGLPEKIQR